MKKINYLFSIVFALLVVTYNIANASEFSDKFYGHAKLGASVSFQNNKFGSHDIWLKKNRAMVNIEFGYNVYYKLNDFIDPFIGVNFRGKIPTGNKIVNDKSEEINGNEYFSANINVGAKLKINKAVSIAPYGLAGLAADKISAEYIWSSFPFSEANIGFIAGSGIEIILFDRFSIGAEYRYGETKFNGFFDGMKIKKQEGVIKFGVYFF